MTDVEYLPEPPETVEAGPNIAAPSADSSWLPGCWVWRQNRYAWRPGFWATVQPNWDWIPDHYMWAPRGYVFVDGYWDRPIDRRGVLFAPVQFNGTRIFPAGFLLLAYDGDRPERIYQSSLFAAALPTLLLRRLLRRQLSAAPGSSPGSPSNPATWATIRFTRTSAGSIGRTAGGNIANRRTSRTAAITKICDRRAHLRPRDCKTRVRLLQEQDSPGSPRCLTI